MEISLEGFYACLCKNIREQRYENILGLCLYFYDKGEVDKFCYVKYIGEAWVHLSANVLEESVPGAEVSGTLSHENMAWVYFI